VKTCPKCSQEFEDFASQCPDCEVPLAAPGAARSANGAAVLRMADALAATIARDVLMEAGVDFQPHAVPGTPFTQFVLDPADLERATGVLASQEGLRADAGVGGVTTYSAIETGDEGSEASLSALPPLPRDPREAISVLADALRKGAPPVRAVAAARLGAAGPAGIEALVAALPEFIEQKKDVAVFVVVRELRERAIDADALKPLVKTARDADARLELRLLALHALGRFELPKLGRELLDLIDDPIPEIREAADEALCCLTDEDLGFDPHLASDERRAFMARWDALLRRQGA
jgi:hypothetical protein